ncbi:MAG: ADOP family duplicated permease [Candidatus Acidiferrales bacterium]
MKRRKRMLEDLDQDIREHIERETQDNIARGMQPGEARYAAVRKFGNVTRVKEETRELWTLVWLEQLVQDIRYGLRTLLRSPGFTAVAVLTLALGIGANTAMFSVVNGVLLKPLPYPNPNRLVALAESWPPFSEASISYPNFLDWASMNHTFEAMAAYRPADFNLTGSGEAQRLKVKEVSASFFSIFGVKPVVGRDFSPEDDKRGAAPTVILSAGLWRNKFGSSPDVLGRTLTLDGTPYTVIGVVPEDFYLCCESMNFELKDIYVPIGTPTFPWQLERGDHPGTRAVGRLKPGVTLEQARADMAGIALGLAATYPDSNKNSGVVLTPLEESVARGVKPTLLVLLAAVGFVLLIACANVANLLSARATRRAREFAIRAALGATQRRVVRQLLTESLLLAIAGGGLGVLLASWGTQAALKALPEALPRANDVHLDLRVLLFTMLVTILGSVLFGLAPALKSSRPDPNEALKGGGRGASGSRHRTTQGVFVVLELALGVVLLIGAGLTIRSLTRLWRVDPGFDPRDVLTFYLSRAPSMAKETPDQVRTMLRQLPDAMAKIPGVKAASLADGAHPMNYDNETEFWIEAQPKPQTVNEMPETLSYMVSPDYLKVMGIPLLRGRFLADNDQAHSSFVGVIDDNFARTYFPNEDPIGKRIRLGYRDFPITIVGVVGHVKQWGLDEDAHSPVKVQLYTLAEQMPDQWMSWLGTNASVVVHTESPSYASADAIRAAIGKMNSEQVAYDFESEDQLISESLASRQFVVILLGVFAASALLLASIGIYGVMSYAVGQRTHEIGVRIALGARRGDVLQMVLGEGAKMAAVGILLGVSAAFGLTRLMGSLLFGVTARDPLTFLGVAILLTLVALLACYIPARRAMRVDPMVALRYE